jgi:hypothetical protein
MNMGYFISKYNIFLFTLTVRLFSRIVDSVVMLVIK